MVDKRCASLVKDTFVKTEGECDRAIFLIPQIRTTILFKLYDICKFNLTEYGKHQSWLVQAEPLPDRKR
jgi:hypothetical protein